MNDSAPRLNWFWSTPERRQQALKYWGSDVAIGLFNLSMHYGLRQLPIDWCSDIGALLSGTSPGRFKASDERARRAWAMLRPGQASEAELNAAMRRLWRCVGRTMSEYSVLDRLWNAGRIEVEGAQHLQDARDRGRSILLAVLHLGNWETALVSVINLGFPGSGIYLPPENRFDLHIARAVRDRYKGGQVAPGPLALRAGIKKLKEPDGLFAIHVDEFVRNRVQAPAFGRPIHSDSNITYAARLARMTPCAVIPAYSVRLGDTAYFKVVYAPAVDMQRSGDAAADDAENVTRINTVIEPIIREHLDQWYYGLDLELDPTAVAKPN